MMDHLCEGADAETFPALQLLRQARGTEAMPGPLAVAERLISILPRLKDRPSGSFVDIREILDPNAHARLYGSAGKPSAYRGVRSVSVSAPLAGARGRICISR